MVSDQAAYSPCGSNPQGAVRSELYATYISARKSVGAAIMRHSRAILVDIEPAARANPQPAVRARSEAPHRATGNLGGCEYPTSRVWANLKQAALRSDPE